MGALNSHQTLFDELKLLQFQSQTNLLGHQSDFILVVIDFSVD